MTEVAMCRAYELGQAAGHDMTDALLERVGRELTVVGETLRHFGSGSVREFAVQACRRSPRAYQPREDLCRALDEYVAPQLGASVAERAADELDHFPVVLSANHHGVDFFAQSVQGTLAFGLTLQERGQTTVPVFAFGNVSLNNLTYPRGLLLYGAVPPSGESLPLKVPVFPGKLNRSMVTSIGPMDTAMLGKTAKRVADLAKSGVVPERVRRMVNDILSREYGSPTVLNLPTYSSQAVVLNERIWRRLFRGGSYPTLVYVEIEQLVSRLLEKDLFDGESLVSLLLFDPRNRAELLQRLDGVSGCWNLGGGKTDRPSATTGGGQRGSGTMFFWGSDPQGRRVPLRIAAGPGGDSFGGLTDSGEHWEIPCSPAAIAEGLRSRRLTPSLFTCFLATALARGVTCLGGYYQARYLPAMQAGVVGALEAAGGSAETIAAVGTVPTRSYLSGMQAVMTRVPGIGLVPAGPVEIAAAGGLAQEDLARILDVSVGDAHRASLFDTLLDAAPEGLPAGWRTSLATEAEERLGDVVVVV